MRDAAESIEPMGMERECGRHSSQSFCPRGLDAIRDSRIASQDGFRDTPCSRSASEVRSRCVIQLDGILYSKYRHSIYSGLGPLHNSGSDYVTSQYIVRV